MAHPVDDDLDDDNLEVKAQETAPAQGAPETPVPAAPPAEDLPEKYRGKSPAEIAKMHQELEKTLGHQGAELGELRRTFDQYLRPTLEQKPSERADSLTESQDDDTQFFLNPKAAIAKAVEEHPLVKELRQSSQMSQHERAKATFTGKHPDHLEVMQDKDFQAWIEASPVRQELLMRAHQNFDVDAGDELFTTFKALRGVKAKAETPDTGHAETVRADALRAGMVPSGNAAPLSSGDGKPIFRRSALIKMQIERPDEYSARIEEIQAAYAEGRVR